MANIYVELLIAKLPVQQQAVALQSCLVFRPNKISVS